MSLTSPPFRNAVRCGVGTFLIIAWAVPGQVSDQSSGGAHSTPEAAAFGAQIDINLVNLYATVIDHHGRPVIGLTAAEFSVLEDGEAMEITHFSEIGSGSSSGVVPTGQTEEHAATDGGTVRRTAAAIGHQPRKVALLFDNTGLEKRQRRRVLKTLGEWAGEVIRDGGQIMVACITPEFGVMQPFTSDAAAVISALTAMADEPTQGDAFKINRRKLKRQMRSTQTALSKPGFGRDAFGGSGFISGDVRIVGADSEETSRGSGSGPPFESDSGIATAQAHQYLDRINFFGEQERLRLSRALAGVERLVRGVSGLPGRKDVVWIGEDIMLRPALDVYHVFYSEFGDPSTELTIEPPEAWAPELDLSRAFRHVAGAAQVAGTVVHVIDTTDRDLDAAVVDFDTTTGRSHDIAGSGEASAIEGSDVFPGWRDNEGSLFLARATGGSCLVGTRDYGRYLDSLKELLGSYYSIGYRRPGAPDGRLHPVRVHVARDGLQVRSPGRVPNPTWDQQLLYLAVSRLLIDHGSNSLGLEVELGARERTDKGRSLQEVVLAIPARNLALVAEGDRHVGRINVALVFADARGNPTAPRTLQYNVAIPSGRMSPRAVAIVRLRILMETDFAKIAVAVRDERSGVRGSAASTVESLLSEERHKSAKQCRQPWRHGVERNHRFSTEG
jgi:VWFA-related protein